MAYRRRIEYWIFAPAGWEWRGVNGGKSGWYRIDDPGEWDLISGALILRCHRAKALKQLDAAPDGARMEMVINRMAVKEWV